MLALPIFVAVMFLVYAIAMGGGRLALGGPLTDWANDGVFGDGWLMPFVSDVEGYEDALGEFEDAVTIVEAWEGGESAAYFFDDETGEIIPTGRKNRNQKERSGPEPTPSTETAGNTAMLRQDLREMEKEIDRLKARSVRWKLKIKFYGIL